MLPGARLPLLGLLVALVCASCASAASSGETAHVSLSATPNTNAPVPRARPPVAASVSLTPEEIAEGAYDDPLPLQEVAYWAYQLQDLSAPGAVDALAASHYDLLVLEPTRTDWSSDDRQFDTAGMVARLRASRASDGVHRKRVLAYVDIGQAEDWRWYWTWSRDWDCRPPRPAGWPDYILSCDPDGWAGNYPVAYWDAGWKDVMIYGLAGGVLPDRNYQSALDEVLRDGFDGIYLDWVEGYEDEAVVTAAQAAGVDPATEMIALIGEIHAYATTRNPDFVVVQQNAAALLEGHPQLVDVIDAVAQEAVWFDGDATDDWNDPDGYDRPQDPDLTTYYLGHLANYQTAGLPVFVCEYALQFAGEAYARSLDQGFVPFVTHSSLSRLTMMPPHDY
ncbi:MAG: endo alpha-1,4 polygalactosaminidase [Anaerolineae bacterium]